jgi:hypothetical protein
MITLDEQVVSLPLAKKLKEFGLKQESYFYWLTNDGNNSFVDNTHTCIQADYPSPEKICSAYTVSELGYILPHTICEGKYRLEFLKNFLSCWLLSYIDDPDKPPFLMSINYKEADVRAQMLIMLIEKGYLKV